MPVGRQPQPRVTAVVNQKGGVAKTTTTHHLSAGCAARGHSVLMVDFDPQASLTYCAGADPQDIDAGVFEVLTGATTFPNVIWEAGDHEHVSGTLHVAPATDELMTADVVLSNQNGGHAALADALKTVADGYDYVFVDCSPTLGQLTLNALTAATDVVIPVSCDMLSHRGVSQLLRTISDVREVLNPALGEPVVLPTMYDARLSHARAVVADVTERFGLTVLDPIPRSVRFAESPANGLTTFHTAPTSRGARAYDNAVTALLALWDEALTA